MSVSLGTTLLLTALTSLAPRRMIPVRSASRPTSKPLTSWRKSRGSPGLVAVQDEPRRLVGAVGVDHAAELERAAADRPEPEPLVGHDPQGHPAQPGEAADERLAVLGAVLVEPPAVDQRGDQVAHVVLRRGVGA